LIQVDSYGRFVRSLCGSKPMSVHSVYEAFTNVTCKKCLARLQKSPGVSGSPFPGDLGGGGNRPPQAVTPTRGAGAKAEEVVSE